MCPTNEYDQGSGAIRSLTYEKDGYKTALKKSWTFASFDPRREASSLRKAVKWLEGYIGRYYLGGSQVPILNDFDEQYQHFDNPIEFPIKQIVDGHIDYERLVVYGNYYNFRVEEQIVGDQYNVHGQTGAVGPNAHAHDINFNQIWNQAESRIDLKSLTKELSTLRAELLREAKAPEQFTAIGAVASAETEAEKGNGAKALEHLSKAGKWAWDTATKIGVTVAAAATKESLGIK